MEPSAESCDVAIIGAGVSGLATAHFLLKAQPALKVLVLEAADRVGGRTLTKEVRCADGKTRGWCFGGAHIGKAQRYVLDLLQDLGLATCETARPPGKTILEVGDFVDRYEGDAPNLGTLTLVDLDRSITKLDKQARALMTNRGSWAALDALTLEKKIEKESWKKNTRNCLAAIMEPCFDGDLGSVSCLQALRIANSAGGLVALMDEGGGLKIAEGAQAISTTLADRIGSNRILLGHHVTLIDQSDPSVVRIEAHGSSGPLQVTARSAVLTLPLASLHRLNFSPEPLPPAKRRLIEATAAMMASPDAASTVVAVVTYREAFWRRSGCSGDLLSHLGSPLDGSRHPVAPIAVAADATTADGRQPALVLLAGYTAEHSWTAPEARRDDLLAHLARFYPAEEVANYVDFVQHDWGLGLPAGASPLPAATEEPEGAGGVCASCYCDSALLTEPVGRLHFAGADFATEWIGCIEGAVQSARRVAGELM